MKMFIKNMVCNRCIFAVEAELQKLGLTANTVSLGLVEFYEEPTEKTVEKLEKSLNLLGFEILNDKKHRIADRVKTLIIDLIYSHDNQLRINLSDYVAGKTGFEYTALSNSFSQTEKTTIEQYYIIQKIERVKELLAYNELSLNEIADLLHYSSASHLSRQFKKVTGKTITEFRKTGFTLRKPLDSL